MQAILSSRTVRDKIARSLRQRHLDDASSTRTVCPTLRDLAWAAGLYEAEGAVTAKAQQKGRICFSVRVTQNEPETLLRLRDLFGGRVTRYLRREHHEWAVYGARAHGFVMTMWPLLSRRRRGQILDAARSYAET
jgi:hypothetical protein